MDALARSAGLGLLFLVASAPASAQDLAAPRPGTISGTVQGRMADERRPLPHAWVTVPDAPGSPTAISGPDGTYILRGVPPGERTVRISRLGYRQVERRGSRRRPGLWPAERPVRRESAS